MEKKLQYEEAEIEVIRFGNEDVIRTSGDGIKTDEEASPTSSTFNFF